MSHKPLRVFDDYLLDFQNSLKVRTEEFYKILSDMSRGEGMMEDDVEFLHKLYGVPHPYE